MLGRHTRTRSIFVYPCLILFVLIVLAPAKSAFAVYGSETVGTYSFSNNKIIIPELESLCSTALGDASPSFVDFEGTNGNGYGNMFYLLYGLYPFAATSSPQGYLNIQNFRTYDFMLHDLIGGSSDCSNGVIDLDTAYGGFANYPMYYPDGDYWYWIHTGNFDKYFPFTLTGGHASIPPVYITNDIASSTTWVPGHTYIVSGNVSIATSTTLTIEAGTVIKFDTATSSSLTVNGTLNALGVRDETADYWEPVFFTSINDDYIGNPPDTNGDGSTTSAMGGDWGGIKVNFGAVANLYGAIIRYAGNAFGAGLYNNGGSLLVASSTIAYNDTYGIYNALGTTTAQADDLSFQNYGLYVNGGFASLTATSTIHDNSSYGVYNNAGFTLNARGNYWGNPSGPSSTYGSQVSTMVDSSSSIPYLHFVDVRCTPKSGTCGSVKNNKLIYTATSTAYTAELAAAIGVWDAENKVDFIATTTQADASLKIYDEYEDDLSTKGEWIPEENQSPDVGIDLLWLNPYYFEQESFSDIEHTIMHELGHAQGLWHSYTGNIMYHNQTSQVDLGPQDLYDYNYLW